jgi:hypothetical protein
MAASADKKIVRVRRDLVALSRSINGKPPRRAKLAWGGAGIVIATEQPEPDPNAWYPEPRYVVTKDELELSWAFLKLRDVFMRVLDGTSKFEFYGRLANAANRYLETTTQRDSSTVDLVAAVLYEAFVMLKEMEDRDFNYLGFTTGNTICDDLIERGDKSGYIGPEATRRFLDDTASKIDHA